MNAELLTSLLTSAAALASVPGTIELALLNTGSVLPGKREKSYATLSNRKLAVVIPAHNEELHIARTVTSLQSCDDGGQPFSVVVIADNCSDATAERAALAGARVLQRSNAIQRGKGFALSFAFDLLLAEGVEQLIVVDADSIVSADFIAAFRRAFAGGAAAAQCAYLVHNSEDSVRTRLMTVALLAFNFLRPYARSRLSLSAGILGNGFGLTRELLAKLPYEAHSVVEDLEYHLRLVDSGCRVQFVDRAVVWGDMPSRGAGVATQRSRWEGGRFRMLLEFGPSLAGRVLRGEWRLLEPLLELALLPLAFHFVLLILACVSPVGMVQGYAAVALAMGAMHVALAAIVGRAGWRVLVSLAIAPLYILWKLTMLPSIWRTSGKTANWARTERSGT